MEDISTVIRNKMRRLLLRRLLLEGIEDKAWSQTWYLVRQPIIALLKKEVAGPIERQIEKEVLWVKQ
jgi:hypothetical protein